MAGQNDEAANSNVRERRRRERHSIFLGSASQKVLGKWMVLVGKSPT